MDRPTRERHRLGAQWNRHLALNEPDLSPRELAVRFTDTEKYFVSEASVYRLLKSYDLITSPAYVAEDGPRADVGVVARPEIEGAGA